MWNPWKSSLRHSISNRGFFKFMPLSALSHSHFHSPSRISLNQATLSNFSSNISVTSGPLCRQSPAPRSKAPPACSSFRQRRPSYISPKNSSHPLLLKNLSHLRPPLSPISGSEVQGTTGLLQLPSTPPIANKTRYFSAFLD